MAFCRTFVKEYYVEQLDKRSTAYENASTIAGQHIDTETTEAIMSKPGDRGRRSKAVRVAATLAFTVAAPAVALAQSDTPRSHGTGNIVEVASAAGSFNTLLAAVKAAGLVETLQGDGPFTVFAPSDAAFAKLPKSTLDQLLADKAALKSLLTFHVVPRRIVAADIVKSSGAKPTTVNGQPLDITVRGGKV
jgi:uncharacterized surface protein with fasciclin (FAS1) repeats